MDKAKKVQYMRLALELAKKAEDMTYPNPMVGAVIVKKGRIIGKGYHRKAGMDHAEIVALKNSKEDPKGADMYVTLEPCAHYGKTPPCIPAIVKSGIKRVFVAMEDPNPIVKGRGIKMLREAGIPVKTGICGEEARHINRKYLKFITKGVPYVTVKLAQTLDGKIAARDGSSKWITSEKCRHFVKRMRSKYDAVMVGANTVLNDDPLLISEDRTGPKVRVVVDSSLRIQREAKLIRTAAEVPVVIATTALASRSRIKELSRFAGVEILEVKSKDKKVSLKVLFKKLAKRNIVNVLVEGGGELVGSLCDEALVDEWMFFISPKVMGGNRASVKGRGAENINRVMELEEVDFTKFGEDFLVRGRTCSRG